MNQILPLNSLNNQSPINHPQTQTDQHESLLPNQLLEPLSNDLIRGMSKKRIMSSRVLDEDTEEVREQREVGETRVGDCSGLRGSQILT